MNFRTFSRASLPSTVHACTCARNLLAAMTTSMLQAAQVGATRANGCKYHMCSHSDLFRRALPIKVLRHSARSCSSPPATSTSSSRLDLTCLLSWNLIAMGRSLESKADSLTVRDNRTGKTFDIPCVSISFHERWCGLDGALCTLVSWTTPSPRPLLRQLLHLGRRENAKRTRQKEALGWQTRDS